MLGLPQQNIFAFFKLWLGDWEDGPYNSWVKLLFFYINICSFITDISSGTNNEFSSTVPSRLQKPFVNLWQNFTYFSFYSYVINNRVGTGNCLVQTLTHIFCQQVTVLYRNARWRPPPSWIWSLFHIRCKCWIVHSSIYFDVKCGENRCNGSKVTVLFLNSRWRSPPSWIL